MNVTKFEFYVDVIMYDRLEKGKISVQSIFKGIVWYVYIN